MRKILDFELEKRIKFYLFEKGIKQSVVAKGSNITAPALNESLNGKRKLSAGEFARIVKFLGVSADLFIQ